MKSHPFPPGQHILVREVWRDRVWSARPEIVVCDTPDMVGLFIPEGTVWKQPRTLDGRRVRPAERGTGKWLLQDVVWEPGTGGRLRLAIPGKPYSVLIFWNGDGSPRSWYINLEEPLKRTAHGFDYIDLLLDAIVEPDLKNWRWKDEDELEEAVALGLVSPQQAQELYAEGEHVVKMLKSGKSAFNCWEKWRPDPAWTVPVLPQGWETP